MLNFMHASSWKQEHKWFKGLSQAESNVSDIDSFFKLGSCTPSSSIHNIGKTNKQDILKIKSLWYIYIDLIDDIDWTKWQHAENKLETNIMDNELYGVNEHFQNHYFNTICLHLL